ncbi:MAG: hypothetical protein HYU75_16450 [Betaproteobacteria bacterium]|nr:hypothetical protein [Betaproteobacteria bacterium]
MKSFDWGLVLSTGKTEPHRFNLNQWALAGVSVIIALLLCSAWLVFPYFVEGRKILFSVGTEIKTKQRIKAVSIGQHLTRYAEYPGQHGDEVETDVLYATPTYFSVTDRAGVVAKYRPDKNLVFIVNETSHTDTLPYQLPEATLAVDGRRYAPISVEGPNQVQHHRATFLLFSRLDAEGNSVVPDGARTLSLLVSDTWNGKASVRTATWDLPITYPDDLVKTGSFTPMMVFALSAGLLSAILTPCLLQLIVIYLATITGLSTGEIGRPGAVSKRANRQVLFVALAFVIGFTVLFTTAGAAIGYIGKEAQLWFAEWSRSVSIVAGILVIALGLWVGIKARAPIVCKIPRARAIEKFGQGNLVGSALMAVGFSLGCMTCFGGAIIATLLIYVGALGSASIGALVLFLFSLGVAIPFLAAALYLSRVLPLMTRLAKYTPALGLVSMLVIMAFGGILVTDNFHVFSSAIYPYLGLN